MANLKRNDKKMAVQLFERGLDEKQVRDELVAIAEGKGKRLKLTTDMIKSCLKKHYKGEADLLWSKAIRLVGHCEICGKQELLQAHHLIRRGKLLFRYILLNGVCLCSGCHFKAHGGNDQTAIFFDQLKIKNPAKWDYFNTNKNNDETVNFSASDYKQICESLQGYIKNKAA